MTPTKLTPPGKYVAPGERLPPGIRVSDDAPIYLGFIWSVDPDRWIVDVELFDRKGYLLGIKVTQPYAGPGSYIASLPEEGSMCVVFVTSLHRWILAYLPNYLSAVESKSLKIWPDSVKIEGKNIFHYRMRKLLAGEVALSSKDGSEIFLSKNARFDVGDMTYMLRHADHAAITRALNINDFAAGVWVESGIIRRNMLSKATTVDGQFAQQIIYGDSTIGYELTTQNTVSPGISEKIIEHRIEVEDTANDIVSPNEFLEDPSGLMYTRKPIVILSMGNYANNSVVDPSYGKLLGLGIFKDIDDYDGALNWVPLSKEDWYNLGLAFTVFKPNRRDQSRGAIIALDKEGHCYQFFPGSTGGGIGENLSMSTRGQGSLKEIWGAEAYYGTSWDLRTEGGVRWLLGRHNDRDGSPYKGRSIDIRSEGGAIHLYGVVFNDQHQLDKDSPIDDKIHDLEKDKATNPVYVSDPQSYSLVEKINGKERHEINGLRETVVSSNEIVRIGGFKQERITASCNQMVGADMSLSVSSTFNETVNKEKQESYGSRKTTINSGSSELIIKPNKTGKGEIKETIQGLGGRLLSVNQGNIEETIVVSGNRKFSTTSGNVEFTSIKGNITLKTIQGDVTITSLGKHSYKATNGFSFSATYPAASFNVDCNGDVNLKGRTKKLGGVITDFTHHDYITGATLKGSSTVKATF